MTKESIQLEDIIVIYKCKTFNRNSKYTRQTLTELERNRQLQNQSKRF